MDSCINEKQENGFLLAASVQTQSSSHDFDQTRRKAIPSLKRIKENLALQRSIQKAGKFQFLFRMKKAEPPFRAEQKRSIYKYRPHLLESAKHGLPRLDPWQRTSKSFGNMASSAEQYTFDKPAFELRRGNFADHCIHRRPLDPSKRHHACI